MKSLVRWLIFAALASTAPAAFCDIFVGDIFFLSNPNGTTQFYLDNLTGATDGCSTPGGFPSCTDLSISGTLTYSYLAGSSTVNGTATLAAPIGPNDQNGGNAYAPANFLFGSTDILSASFFGTLTPPDFSTDIGPFNSNGLVVSSSDVVAGGGYALLATSPASTVTPEPSSYLFLSFLLLGSVLVVRLERKRRARISRQ
jgi:hypothetical protein